MGLDPFVELTIETLFLVLILSLPPIVVATTASIIVAILQAITQIQDQTLTTGVKLVVTTLTLAVTGYWLSSYLIDFAQSLFEEFPRFVQ